MEISEIGDSSFESAVTNTKGLVLVDFWAPWCGPCKNLGTVLEELSTEFSGRATIVKLNVDDNSKISSQLKIRAVPTVVMFKDGQELSRQSGARPKLHFKDWILQNL